MRSRYLSLTIFLLLLLGQHMLSGQMPNLQFEHLTIEDGLANNEVRCIFQDSKGFMWFGTMGGLNRFDGREMKTYLPDRNNQERISFSQFKTIIEDQQGKIWLAGYGIPGINSYDPEKETFKEYLYPDSKQSPFDYIYEDRRGNLWVGSWDYGILRFDKEKERFEPFPVELPDGANKEKVTAIQEDSFDHLWFAVSDGLYSFSWQDSSFHFYPFPGGVKGSKDVFVETIFEDSRKDLYVGTVGTGLFLFQKDTDRFLQLINSPGAIYSINEDVNDWLWIATDKGLKLYDPKRKRFSSFKSLANNPVAPEEFWVWSIYRDRQGDMWLGTKLSGVSHWNRYRKKFHSYQYPALNKQEPIKNSVTRCMFEQSAGQIWMNIGANVVMFDPDKERFAPEIYPIDAWTLFEDKKGWVWMGTWDQGLSRFHVDQKQVYYYQLDSTKAAGLPGTNTPYVFQDRQETIWVGVRGLGLYRYIPSDDSFEAYPIYHSQTGNPASLLVNAMYEDRKGNLWLGEGGLTKIHPGRDNYTHYPLENWNVGVILTIYEDANGVLWLGTDLGLVCFNLENETFQIWTTKDGLAGNRVSGILEDDRRNLWISTSKGLSRFDPQTRQFRNYDTADGLPSDQFLQNAYLKTKNGEMYFGGLNGFVRFHPDSIMDNPNKPPVFITNIRISNQEVPVAGTFGDTLEPPSPLFRQMSYTKEISLAYWQKDLSFEFAALNFSHPEKNRYQYQMENYDKDWIDTDASRPYATYTNLGPGSYTFRVKGSNNDGQWNEENTSLLITINPPWWWNAWSKGLYLLLFLSGLWSLRRYEMSRQKLHYDLEMEQLKAEKLEEVDELKTRFFTNITHEFRTPLTIILGMARQIRDDPKKWYSEGLQMITRNGRQLLHLVNQMLDLSKLDHGKLKLNLQQGEVVGFIHYLVQSFESFAAGKGVQLHFLREIDQLEMDFDPDQLTTVLSNLLSNAVKYTPEGGQVYVIVDSHKSPVVSRGQVADNRQFSSKQPANDFRSRPPVQASHQSLITDYLQLKIKDTGPGIAPEELSRIFDRFYQTDHSATVKARGTGLGLALTSYTSVFGGGRGSAKPV